MHYFVPNMKLIPQDKDWSCWYASGQMLIEWRRQQTRRTEPAHPDPSQVKKWGYLYDKASGPEGGITNDTILEFARDLGFEAEKTKRRGQALHLTLSTLFSACITARLTVA